MTHHLCCIVIAASGFAMDAGMGRTRWGSVLNLMKLLILAVFIGDIAIFLRGKNVFQKRAGRTEGPGPTAS